MENRTAVLLADPRIARVPVLDCRESMRDLRTIPAIVVDPRQADPAGAFAHVRTGVARMLLRAHRLLPAGWRLVLVEGYRPPSLQRRYVEEYLQTLSRRHPSWERDRLIVSASRYISPPEVAPHTTGGAVDVTLADPAGGLAWMGTEVNATPEESDGATWTDAPNLSPAAVRHRALAECRVLPPTRGPGGAARRSRPRPNRTPPPASPARPDPHAAGHRPGPSFATSPG